jgi:hypothetical protein
LSHINPVYTSPSYLSKIHYINSLHSSYAKTSWGDTEQKLYRQLACELCP